MLPNEQKSRLVYQLAGVGHDSYRRQIAVTCRAGGVRCEFLGDVDDDALPGLYAGATIYAQASRTLPRSVEGFGISLLEAGFFGCPIAAFRSGGIAEAVADGKSATLVAEGDVAGLSRSISKLLDDPALRLDYGEAGRQFARQFSWAASARTFCDYLAAH